MEIITQHMSCVALPGEFEAAKEAGYSEIYVMTGEGIIKYHKLRGNNRFVQLKVDKLPTSYKAPEVGQGINFLPAGRIPIELFDQVVAFFKQVMEVKKSELEAMIWICWDRETGYHLIVPDQRVSKASASYDWASLPAGKTIVCDIHSHNTMGAFFSGTDNRDDQGNIGFSGVCGRLKDQEPQTVWRFNYKDKKIDCEFEDIFTLPQRQEQTVPEDWITKIQTPAPVTSYQGGNSQKGKADHLKPWQFQKGGSASNGTAAGNRQGPYLQDQRRLLPDEPFGNEALQSASGFGWDNWEFDPSLAHPDDTFDLTKGFPDERMSAAERALARVNEDPEYEAWARNYDPRFDPDVDQSTGEIRGRDQGQEESQYSGDPRFEDTKALYGDNSAEVYCIIDDLMPALDTQDELVETLMTDMIHMATDEGKELIFKRIFQELPDTVQERIQTTGIH